VPVEDAEALAAGIVALTDDPQRAARLARQGRAAYERDFTETAVVARWRGFLVDVAPRRKAA
jgi:glycosyltransferase involved in cell wall biosynthesis